MSTDDVVPGSLKWDVLGSDSDCSDVSGEVQDLEISFRAENLLKASGYETQKTVLNWFNQVGVETGPSFDEDRVTFHISLHDPRGGLCAFTSGGTLMGRYGSPFLIMVVTLITSP